MPESPRPSSVSARPVATWLVTSVSVRKPNSSENSAPTTMAARTSSHGDPVVSATPKPVTAPMIIMPSTPRLSTPERSTTSSPTAARSSGVAAVKTVIRIASNIGPSRLPGRRHMTGGEADAVMDEGVAGEHEEQDHALEHAHHPLRKADGNLRRLAAQIGERKHQSRRHDSERIE